MDAQLFHIFRNTPLGRETLMQSMYFCKQVDAAPTVYIPEHTKFLMYFENDVVQIDLDPSYLTAPATARRHAADLLSERGFDPAFFTPKHFTASTLPDVPTHFDFMCCPRSISDLSSKIGLGYIGPRVRRIVQSAHFPVLITSPVYKPWKSIAVFFGGSNNAFNALRLGLRLQRISGMLMEIYTHAVGKDPAEYEAAVAEKGLSEEITQAGVRWHFFTQGVFEENLYDIPHDALAVIGAFGHGLIRDIVFGSTMEKVQSILSNNLLIVGPKYAATV